MKKKIGIIVAFLLAIITISIFLFIGQPRIIIGNSEKFNQNEIKNAISCVKKENTEFKKIWYNEEESERILVEFKKSDSDSENFIAIGSNFKKDNDSHENYVWILKRQNPSDNWRIIDSYYLD